MADLKALRRQVDQQIGKRDQIQRDLDDTRLRERKQKRQIDRIQKAQEITRAVAQRTQSQLEYHIGSVVGHAQAAVFDDPYTMDVAFEQRRGRTECDLWFKREEQRINPLQAGLGAVDVAAFALRVASWSLARRKTRPVLLLDEPFSRLKGTAQNKRAIELMKQVSQELGLQIITISDERAPREDIMAGADRVIEVRNNNGVSQVHLVE